MRGKRDRAPYGSDTGVTAFVPVPALLVATQGRPRARPRSAPRRWSAYVSPGFLPIGAGEASVLKQYLAAIDAAREGIYVENQFLASVPVLARLAAAVHRGVEVVVVLPGIPMPAVRAARAEPRGAPFFERANQIRPRGASFSGAPVVAPRSSWTQSCDAQGVAEWGDIVTFVVTSVRVSVLWLHGQNAMDFQAFWVHYDAVHQQAEQALAALSIEAVHATRDEPAVRQHTLSACGFGILVG
jgi:hypothetical protein